jgi:acetyl-CoA acetyltransferase
MADKQPFRNKVAIVSYGIAKTVRRSDIPIGAMAVETADQAIKDAGLTRAQIDGVATASSLPAYATGRVLEAGHGYVTANFLIEHMRLDTRWAYDEYSFPPAVARAAEAVASGAASYVLLNRMMHNPPGRYHSFTEPTASGAQQWTTPFGYIAPTSGIAMPYMEYQQRYGMKREHLGTLAVQIRENVQSIPEAYWYGTPLTTEDYMTSRMISEPMCVYDNDIPVDGGGSFIITTAERAADMPHKAVYITDWNELQNPRRPIPGTWGTLSDLYETTTRMADKLWNRTGWTAKDVDVPQMYDGFLPMALWWMECLRFCEFGEAWQMIQGGRIHPKGDFPLLSGGGNIGWGRLHGLPHILECYLQLSGRAGSRQINDAVTGASTYSIPGFAGATILLFSSDPAA